MFGQMKTNTQMIKIKTKKIKKRRILYWTSFRTVDITEVFSVTDKMQKYLQPKEMP